MCIGCEIEARVSIAKIIEEINDGVVREYTFAEMMDAVLLITLNNEEREH